MSVSAITDQALALQQQLTWDRALVEPAHGAVPETVAVELVPAWSLFGVCETPAAGDALVALAANVAAERPGVKILTEALLNPSALVRPDGMRGRTSRKGQL